MRVTFNGFDEEVRCNPHEEVRRLLFLAKVAFGVEAREGLGLFTEGGTEVPLGSPVGDIDSGALLILRPTVVH